LERLAAGRKVQAEPPHLIRVLGSRFRPWVRSILALSAVFSLVSGILLGLYLPLNLVRAGTGPKEREALAVLHRVYEEAGARAQAESLGKEINLPAEFSPPENLRKAFLYDRLVAPLPVASAAPAERTDAARGEEAAEPSETPEETKGTEGGEAGGTEEATPPEAPVDPRPIQDRMVETWRKRAETLRKAGRFEEAMNFLTKVVFQQKHLGALIGEIQKTHVAWKSRVSEAIDTQLREAGMLAAQHKYREARAVLGNCPALWRERFPDLTAKLTAARKIIDAREASYRDAQILNKAKREVPVGDWMWLIRNRTDFRANWLARWKGWGWDDKTRILRFEGDKAVLHTAFANEKKWLDYEISMDLKSTNKVEIAVRYRRGQSKTMSAVFPSLKQWTSYRVKAQGSKYLWYHGDGRFIFERNARLETGGLCFYLPEGGSIEIRNLKIRMIALREKAPEKKPELPKPKVKFGIQIRDGEKGVFVVSVNEKSAAEKAGLRADDVITHLDTVAVRTVTDFHRFLLEKKAGDRVRVRFLRNEKKKRVTVKLEPWK
ncbi:MAG: PDZ domain-containing protein, partial [Planctomycetota bacterium]